MTLITTTETLLQNLPWGISIWSGVLLSWGFYLNLLLKYIVISENKKENVSMFGMNEIPFIHIANCVLLFYIIFGPFLAKYINDTFVVINIFYSTFLSCTTFNVSKWKITSLSRQKIKHKTH